MVNISLSSIVSAFSKDCIGTKVKPKYQEQFLLALADAIEKHNFSKDIIPGQSILDLKNCNDSIFPGVGKSSLDVKDYVLRSYRGKVSAYLKRSKAIHTPIINVRAVVYTTSAYIDDPDINETPGEAERIIKENPTHVLVAVLSDLQGKKSVFSPYRLAKNMAGGNHEFLKMDADQLRQKAIEVCEDVDSWSVVAD
jgi:hypothetical protein